MKNPRQGQPETLTFTPASGIRSRIKKEIQAKRPLKISMSQIINEALIDYLNARDDAAKKASAA